MFILAPDRDYNLNRFERYFALAKSGKIEPVIILNKTLGFNISTEKPELLAPVSIKFNSDIFLSSSNY